MRAIIFAFVLFTSSAALAETVCGVPETVGTQNEDQKPRFFVQFKDNTEKYDISPNLGYSLVSTVANQLRICITDEYHHLFWNLSTVEKN
jgi:hypothetical protein